MVGMADDLLLTLLTMLMVVILCLRRATNVVFMSTAVILANIVGFGLGKGIAALFDLTALPDMAVNPLSTFLCTQAVGFLVEFSARRPAFEDARGGKALHRKKEIGERLVRADGIAPRLALFAHLQNASVRAQADEGSEVIGHTRVMSAMMTGFCLVFL